MVISRFWALPATNDHVAGCTTAFRLSKGPHRRMAQIKKERRKSPRFALTRSILYNQANRLASARTADIGFGGIRVLSELPLRKGDPFEFILILEGMGLKFRGTVVHATPAPDGRVVAGICFSEDSRLSMIVLDDYLKSHMDTLPLVEGPLDLDRLPS